MNVGAFLPASLDTPSNESTFTSAPSSFFLLFCCVKACGSAARVTDMKDSGPNLGDFANFSTSDPTPTPQMTSILKTWI